MKQKENGGVIEYDDRTPGEDVVVAGRFLVYLMFGLAVLILLAAIIFSLIIYWRPIIFIQAFFVSVGMVISATTLMFFISILDSLHVQIKLLSVLIEKDEDV